jgi:hypothetical protein
VTPVTDIAARNGYSFWLNFIHELAATGVVTAARQMRNR